MCVLGFLLLYFPEIERGFLRFQSLASSSSAAAAAATSSVRSEKREKDDLVGFGSISGRFVAL